MHDASAPRALSPRLLERLGHVRDTTGLVLFLTGAGVSAESGVPTFRGPEGYWTVGSASYRPEELATFAAFRRMPEEVWGWYLHRRGVCRRAQPNPAHEALVRAEQALGDRFLLVTQNVDGLHLRAGNTPARTYAIHGDLDRLRCDRCGAIAPVPDALPLDWPRGRAVTPEERRDLWCPAHDDWLRPHVLLFDEYYDEPRFRFESSLEAAERAALLVVVGTSGATNLPSQVVHTVARRGAPLLVLDPGETPFTTLADHLPHGEVLTGTASALLPLVVDALLGA